MPTPALDLIHAVRAGAPVPSSAPWLQLLVDAEDRHVNLERFLSIEAVRASNPVLDYTERTLEVLSGLSIASGDKAILDIVLAWSEAAKGGTFAERRKLQQDGINLYVHNVGSAELYRRHMGATTPEGRLIHALIATHGLLGQFLRGEVPLSRNQVLYDLIMEDVVSEERMWTLLLALNECVIAGVSPDLWSEVKDQVVRTISWIVTGRFEMGWDLKERLRRLRARAVHHGENFEEAYAESLSDPKRVEVLERLGDKDLWYPEPALGDFSFEEFVRILLLVAESPEVADAAHLNFEPLMQSLYYDYRGAKRLNLYRKRVIERYLQELSRGEAFDSPHLQHSVTRLEQLPDTVFATFEFTPVAEALIHFCVEAEKSNTQYQQAIVLLYDFFDFRRDAYDRLHNEGRYLAQMNQTVDYKRLMLDYVAGESILDIGPGGGAMLDLAAERFPEKRVLGIDIAQNVLEELRRRKVAEARTWELLQGDALNLSEYVEPGSVSTVLFSSVLHELFSYIPFEGRRFNHDTLRAALRSAYSVLPEGGRIVIRDGIMSEPEDEEVIIRFREQGGLDMLRRYQAEFKGRRIEYELVAHNEVRMRINDAMEFLYTYTWGEESFPHEVQEQFGVLPPSAYRALIEEALGPRANILRFDHFLQDGYTVALSPKVEFFDSQRVPRDLPDSTCLIVIEKGSAR